MLKNMDFGWPLYIIYLFLFCLTVSSQVSAEILTIHGTNLNHGASLAVSVDKQDLHEVAKSVLMAETWLRNNVLLYYPASNITHIVVGHNLLCSHQTHDQLHHNLILPALKNLHHSLTRWGLHSEIKVSPSISSQCLTSHTFHIIHKPVVHFLHSTKSTYLVNPQHEINPKFDTLVQTHLGFIKKLGFKTFEDINFVHNPSQETKPTMRKLSYVLPTSSPPKYYPIAKGPLPPLIGVGPTISPPSPNTDPHMGLAPTYSPHPHHHRHLPPCIPWTGPVASPPRHEAPGPVVAEEKLWCVAKPSVPADTLQEGMDYACGEGGAECDEIQPKGSCFFPDTIVAHASYAYNSYWQKTRNNGGTCSFGGTAMIINSDPSFLECRFTVT